MTENKDEKKIIIDEDWKEQAKKEKDILAAQEKEEKEKTKTEKKQRGPLPEGDIAAMISMFVTQALFALGVLAVEGQEDKKKEPDLEMAKYNIDMLNTLQEKTKGNLTEQEEQALENMLSQVRMAYVQVAG